eukprot:58891-Prorocentrum_minimum.AAC.1
MLGNEMQVACPYWQPPGHSPRGLEGDTDGGGVTIQKETIRARNLWHRTRARHGHCRIDR